MDAFFHWLNAFLDPSDITTTIIALCLISGIGLLLGKLRIGGISLGITFVFFAGIIAAHFGLKADPNLVAFAENLGLVLFVYALGLEVGPAFFPSLKKGGILYNLLSLLMVIITLILCVIVAKLFNINIPVVTGIMSGAVTNTPSLGAAQTTLHQIIPNNPHLLSTLSDMALGCAVAYPLGVVGVILIMITLGAIAPKNNKSHEKRSSRTAFFFELVVCNPALDEKEIREVGRLIPAKFVISRIWRNGKVCIPRSDFKLQQKDHLLITAKENDVESLTALFGKKVNKDWNSPDINWEKIDKTLTSRRIIVTKEELNGVKLGTLRLRNLYAINITRVIRAGVELLPDTGLRIQLGDRLIVVGEASELKQVSDLLGDSISILEKPNLVSFFFGVTLGCMIGCVPIFLPGISMPIRLGLAGGPIIIGILMGAYGPHLKLSTYMTSSANQLLRQIGIVLYLAGLGLSSGAHFFETVFSQSGLIWITIGFIITMLPCIIIGFCCLKFLRMDLGSTTGMLCGSMANPMVLDFANDQVQSDRPSVVYATVYPLTMFIRIISAQVLVMLFHAI